MNTPWRLGDKQFPLTATWVRNLLAPFASKHTGRDELAKIETDEAKRLLENPAYNSADACEAKCKAHMGLTVDNQTAAASSWSEVQDCPVPKDACFNLHPGLCEGRDRDVLNNLSAFMSHIPKRSALLKFERAGCRANQKIAVFFRTVLGRVPKLAISNFVRTWETGKAACKFKPKRLPV